MRRQDAKDALDKIPLCGLSFPAEGEGGKTGSWRVKRPIVRAEKCLLMRGKKSVPPLLGLLPGRGREPDCAARDRLRLLQGVWPVRP